MTLEMTIKSRVLKWKHIKLAALHCNCVHRKENPLYLLTVTVQIRNQKGDQKELMAAILANCHSISMD